MVSIEYGIFSLTLSAIDAIVILTMFYQYMVDSKLYNIIFGQSLISDTVSMVMYD